MVQICTAGCQFKQEQGARSERRPCLGLARASVETDQEKAREPGIKGPISVRECTSLYGFYGIVSQPTTKKTKTSPSNTSIMVSDSTLHMRSSSRLGEKLKLIRQRTDSAPSQWSMGMCHLNTFSEKDSLKEWLLLLFITDMREVAYRKKILWEELKSCALLWDGWQLGMLYGFPLERFGDLSSGGWPVKWF